MNVQHKLQIIHLHQLQEICDKMKCQRGSRNEMIRNLLKPLYPNYSMESKSFIKFKKGYLDNLQKDQKYL